MQQDSGPAVSAVIRGSCLGLCELSEDSDCRRNMSASEAWPKNMRCRRADEKDSGRGKEHAVLGNIFFYVDVSGTHPAEDEDEFWMAALIGWGIVVVAFIAERNSILWTIV